MKLESQMVSKRCRSLENEVIITLKVAGRLCTQRTYADLIKSCKKIVPAYFDFEAANILLKDIKTGLLFTMSETYENKEGEVSQEEDEESLSSEFEKMIDSDD